MSVFAKFRDKVGLIDLSNPFLEVLKFYNPSPSLISTEIFNGALSASVEEAH